MRALLGWVEERDQVQCCLLTISDCLDECVCRARVRGYIFKERLFEKVLFYDARAATAYVYTCK